MIQYADKSILYAKYEHCAILERQKAELVQHIILVDAHRLIRVALQRIIDACPHLHIQASLCRTQQVFTFRDIAAAQVIMLGPSVALSDCLAFIKQIRECHLQCGVVVIQQDLCPETVHMLVEQGVYALLDEQASEQDLIQAITAAAHGDCFLSQSARNMLAVARSRSAGNLTEREIQVLAHLKQGETNFRIANLLGLKEKTIEKYLTTIYDKLNVRSRTEAILCLQKLHF
ncbi:response regulator transcription factor [Dictyobacter formicarum]|uniref:DNA-binding response regulator n=1 Tax=Dictyobacter formicarum TaxID=2778368 RepID=A0ABQ3VTK1_9CHLR|nr:response regulator transcription factor [Dictyobacter formicarum]GHO89560.1 DNA-binding response regulator [Dictyobacter formicarum]